MSAPALVQHFLFLQSFSTFITGQTHGIGFLDFLIVFDNSLEIVK